LKPAELKARLDGLRKNSAFGILGLKHAFEKHGQGFPSADTYQKGVMEILKKKPDKIYAFWHKKNGEPQWKFVYYVENKANEIRINERNGTITNALLNISASKSKKRAIDVEVSYDS
jgi:hypothetical protein